MLTIKGTVTQLREVNESDAAAIIELRNNPVLNKFLSSQQKILVEDQVSWIRRNKKRADNTYFIIEDINNQATGTISIYNILDKQGEFGRYICINSLNAIESVLLLLEYSFNTLQLDKVYCRTVNENTKVWNQHLKMGFVTEKIYTDAEFGKEMVYQSISRHSYEGQDYTSIYMLLSKFKNK